MLPALGNADYRLQNRVRGHTMFEPSAIQARASSISERPVAHVITSFGVVCSVLATALQLWVSDPPPVSA